MILPLWKIVKGDVQTVLRTWPAACVHCVVTSPPYWNLRDYRQPGQGGKEPTFAEHVNWFVDVGREIRRVLRPDGTWWMNYGDKWAHERIAAARGLGEPIERLRQSRAVGQEDLLTIPEN